MTIYQPQEDSYLMSRILKQRLPELLKQNPDLKFLEIGAGSGIHLETANNLGVKRENIFPVDVDTSSVDHCNVLGFNCIHSDLFENVKGKFNLIIFNPPYLPYDQKEPKESQISTTGGKKGNEIILRFLKDAKDYLKKNGRIFLITSDLAEQIDFKKLEFIEKEIGCENLFFERLCIWELKEIA
ncbi:MAG: methyltransferase [Candidatus Pacearchaeota archaeon]|jgi:release factor glutamine methyltransferase